MDIEEFEVPTRMRAIIWNIFWCVMFMIFIMSYLPLDKFIIYLNIESRITIQQLYLFNIGIISLLASSLLWLSISGFITAQKIIDEKRNPPKGSKVYYKIKIRYGETAVKSARFIQVTCVFYLFLFVYLLYLLRVIFNVI